MNFLDKVSLVGRILLGLYFLFHGIDYFNHPEFYTALHDFGFWFYVMSALEIVGGVFLILGFKPRATAGVLAIVLIIQTIQIHSNLEIPEMSDEAVHFYRYTQHLLVMTQIALIGGCMFLAGARKVQHSIFARTEENMIEKYGK